MLLRNYSLENLDSGTDIFLSGTIIEDVTQTQPCIATAENKQVPLNELETGNEEAGVTLIPHALHASKSEIIKTIVLLTNDTDILVLAP